MITRILQTWTTDLNALSVSTEAVNHLTYVLQSIALARLGRVTAAVVRLLLHLRRRLNRRLAAAVTRWVLVSHKAQHKEMEYSAQLTMQPLGQLQTVATMFVRLQMAALPLHGQLNCIVTYN